MSATAEFAAERLILGTYRNNAYGLAIFLAKECNSARSTSLINTHNTRYNRLSSKNLLVNQVLYLGKLLRRKRLKVSEVKTQMLWRNKGTSLRNMLTNDLLQSSIKQVRSSVVAAKQPTALSIHRSRDAIANMNLTSGHCGNMSINACMIFGVTHRNRQAISAKRTSVALLTTHLGVERGCIKNNLDTLPCLCALNALSITNKGQDLRAIQALIGVTLERCCRKRVRKLYPDIVEGAPSIALSSRTSTLLLLGHASIKARHINIVASRTSDLNRQIDGETKGVMQLKGNITRKDSTLIKSCKSLIEVDTAIIKRGREALFLCSNNTAYQRNVLKELRVCFAHKLIDLVDKGVEECTLNAQETAMEHGATQQATQNILATLVARKNAIGNQEVNSTSVVGNDTKATACTLVGRSIVRLTRNLLTQSNQALHKVAVIVCTLVLHDGSHALQTHASIKVTMRKLRHRTVLLAIKLRKYEVPELQEAIAIAARGAIGATAAHFLTLIEVNLRARTTRTSRTSSPEVVILTQTGNVVVCYAK